MTKMTGGQALVQSLIAHGVDTIFGLPGVQLDDTFDALYLAKDNIQVIHTRHEQATAYMAFGYAQSTGKVGVYLVVPGPGLLNTTGALSTAYAMNAPVLAISGQIQSDLINKGLGELHEIPNQLAMIRHLTKWAERIDRPSDAPALVREAFRQLHAPRIRPVELEMARDVMGAAEEVDLGQPFDPATVTPPEIDPDLLRQAGKLLGEAENPVIAIGGGSTGASDQITQLAEMLQAPVIATNNARGVVSSKNPLSLTTLGGRRVWGDADVVIAIGTRFGVFEGWGLKGLKVIRIDADPTELEHYPELDLKITGVVPEAINQLLPEVERHNRARRSRADEMQAVHQWVEDQLFEHQPSHDFAVAIREELPDDGFLVSEITQLGAYSEIGMPFYEPRTFVGAGYQGTLGFGFATALGTQVANPDKRVISINGDGGFMYTMPELSTAVRHKIPLVAIVIVDGAFGNVKHIQQTRYGGRMIASDLLNPDLVALAESFGAAGLRATNADELRAAIREGFANNHPTLIEVPVDKLPPIRGIVRGLIRE